MNQVDSGKSFVSVIVSFKNEAKNLKKHVEALMGQEYPKDRYEIILVDDGSTDNSMQIVKNEINGKSTPVVKLIQLDWVGTPAARNEGIQNSEGEIVAITDADAIPDPNWLLELSNSFKDKEVGIVSGKIKEIDSINDVNQSIECTIREETFWFTNVAFRQIVFEKIAGFDRRFKRGSDYDFIVRVLNAGFKQAYNANAVVWHLKSPLNLSKALKAEFRNGKADILFLIVNARIFLRNFIKVPLSIKRAIANTLATLFSVPLLVVAFLLGGIPDLLFGIVLIIIFIATRVYLSKTRRFRFIRALACIPLSIALWYHLLKSIPLAFHRRSEETYLLSHV